MDFETVIGGGGGCSRHPGDLENMTKGGGGPLVFLLKLFLAPLQKKSGYGPDQLNLRSGLLSR